MCDGKVDCIESGDDEELCEKNDRYTGEETEDHEKENLKAALLKELKRKETTKQIENFISVKFFSRACSFCRTLQSLAKGDSSLI